MRTLALSTSFVSELNVEANIFIRLEDEEYVYYGSRILCCRCNAKSGM